MRFIDKHVTSPFLHKFASSGRSPLALIQHVDAASGNLSEGLIIVEPIGSGFLLALPNEPNLEWYRKILAEGYCTLRWHGRMYDLSKSTPVDAKTALRAFPLPLRLILRACVAKHFWIMSAQISRQLKRASSHSYGDNAKPSRSQADA